MKNNYYYQVHIFFSANDGYSKFFKRNKPLDGAEIISEAIIEFPDIYDDIEMCDYAVEITEENYNKATADL